MAELFSWIYRESSVLGLTASTFALWFSLWAWIRARDVKRRVYARDFVEELSAAREATVRIKILIAEYDLRNAEYEQSRLQIELARIHHRRKELGFEQLQTARELTRDVGRYLREAKDKDGQLRYSTRENLEIAISSLIDVLGEAQGESQRSVDRQ